jgi:CBS domain-containing protein
MAAHRGARYGGPMKVHEIMTAHARCIGPENTLVEAAGLMRELDVGALPVLENGELAGMLTDRDLVVRAIADGRDPNETPVRDAMSPSAMFVLADQEVEEAVRVMQQRQVRRLPVLDRARRLVGIVSLGDIAVASHPAFGGMALRDVSESERTLGHPGARTPAAVADRRVRFGRDGAGDEPAGETAAPETSSGRTRRSAPRGRGDGENPKAKSRRTQEGARGKTHRGSNQRAGSSRGRGTRGARGSGAGSRRASRSRAG